VLNLTPEEEIVEAMIRYEGLSLDEAKLSYKSRQNLPDSAFCGPKRTYPAHDAAYVRAGIQRLSQFGHRLAPAVRAKILGCLKRRAKRFGVEISESYRWNEDGAENPAVKAQTDSIVKGFLEKRKIPEKCKECGD